MAQDWKEMLAAMANDVPAAQETVEQPAESGEEIDTKRQKEPLRVIIDKKGRKGKTATIIEGFDLDDDETDRIASELKKKIGTGGSARGGEILLQGEWKEKAVILLKALGFNVKA